LHATKAQVEVQKRESHFTILKYFMNLHLQKSIIKNQQSITITGSKSESNRLLLLQALYPEIELENVSNSDDSELMQKALKSGAEIIDIHHAGTAMRFLTAYFATQNKREVVLTGSPRMKERPIKILVDALQDLGADIAYIENQGFPPIKIKGNTLVKHKVSLKANVSSQYISALLLNAPKLQNGIELTLEGKITSVPYIKMTLSLLESIGVTTSFVDNVITVHPKPSVVKHELLIESDWSSASYYYGIVALSDIGTEVTLSHYKENSLQGDASLAEIYKSFGVETKFTNNTIRLTKTGNGQSNTLEVQLNNSPDIAPTLAVTAFGLGMPCYLTG
jgi:3-phosphoshikimate 1-carboxyvinyltransferase